MDYWPSYIPKPSSLSESVDDPYIEATSETGDDSARVRYSKERQGPTKLTWKIMRLGDFVALKQFYADHRAIEFLWLHPSRGLTYKTRFVSSPISSSEDGKSPFVAQVEVTLQIVELAPTEQEQPSVSDLMDTINTGADKAVQAMIDAEQARDDAKDYAKKAAASAKEAADTAAEIPAAVEAGIERIEEAGAAQVEAVNSAGTTQVSKVNSAGTKQTTAVNSAGTAQVSKVNSAGAAQVKAVEDAGSEQIAAVKSEGKAQTAAAKKQADAAAASAEEAAERLAEFKDLGAAAKTLAAGSKATASFNSSTGILTIGVPEGKKGDKGDPGTFSEDGVTVVANASGEAMAKDVAIRGDLGDLASARGQIGPARELGNNVDFNTVTEAGLYLINAAGSVNAPRGNQAFFLQVVRSVKGAITKNLFQIAYNYSSVADLVFIRQYRMASSSWSVWTQFITSSQVGDGLTVNNGIISVPEYEGATASAAGTSGLVPPAAAGQHESFLTGGGEYKPALTKISDSVNLADSKTAASAKAVKAAYDRGTDGVTAANGKLSLSGGVMSGRIGGLRGNYNADASSRYVAGALEIRENGGVGNAQSDIAYAPTIGFHWANRVAGLLALRSDGIFSFMKQNGTRAVVDCDVPYATAANKLRREGGVDTSWWWSGQGGQPGWLWGGNDGVNMYVYNPANFSVNYANSAGGARTVSINYAAYNDFPLNANFTMPFDGLAVIFVTGSGWGHIKLFVNGAEVSRARMYGEDSANPCDSPSAFVRSGIVVQGQVNGSRISGVVRCFPGA